MVFRGIAASGFFLIVFFVAVVSAVGHIELVPEIVHQEENLSVIVHPGNDGFYEFIYVYDVHGDQKKRINFGCDDVCFGKQVYNLSVDSSYLGEYYVEAFDFSEPEGYIVAFFSVVEPELVVPNLRFVPGVVLTDSGEEFVLNIEVENAHELYSFSSDIQFNASLLEYVGVVEGDFLNGDGQETDLTEPATQDEGILGGLGVSRIGDVGGVNGSGELMSIRFRTIENGSDVVSFESSDLVNSSLDSVLHNKATAVIVIGVVPDFCIDQDGDGYGVGCVLGDDCNDSDSAIRPGEIEVCDGQDNNCDEVIDEGCGGNGNNGGNGPSPSQPGPRPPGPRPPNGPHHPPVSPDPGNCSVNWICGNWTECVNGTKQRICEDLSMCGTNDKKPDEVKDCSVKRTFLLIGIGVLIVVLLAAVMFVVIYFFNCKKEKQIFRVGGSEAQ